MEATADYLNQDGAEVMKALCGHDPMEGEKKNVQEPVSFDGTFPIIVTSNEKLNIRVAGSGDEAAQSRRVLIIEFSKLRAANAEMIDHFEQLLFDQENEGIFAWMIEGAQKLWNELSQGKGFQISDTQKKRINDLISRSKSIETFITARVVTVSAGDVTTAGSTMIATNGTGQFTRPSSTATEGLSGLYQMKTFSKSLRNIFTRWPGPEKTRTITESTSFTSNAKTENGLSIYPELMSQYTTESITNLPSTEQLGNYRTLTARLLDDPQSTSAEERESFLKILGELEPCQLTGDKIEIFEQVFPTEWRAYGETHWSSEG